MGIAVHTNLARVNPNPAVGETANLIELIRDEDDCASRGRHPPSCRVIFLEIYVADGQGFIDEENLWPEVCTSDASLKAQKVSSFFRRREATGDRGNASIECRSPSSTCKPRRYSLLMPLAWMAVLFIVQTILTHGRQRRTPYD